MVVGVEAQLVNGLWILLGIDVDIVIDIYGRSKVLITSRN
jgi:hypothetical protein